jgi:uncharacterized membrane protein (DUF485 family)
METATSSTRYPDQTEHHVPPSGSQFGNASQSSVVGTAPDEPDYEAIYHSPEFASLRRHVRGFVFPVGLLWLAWYFVYVILSAYAPKFMSEEVIGAVNMGFVLGLLQFVTTAVLVVWYGRYARKELDPRIEAIREQANQQ